jgi:hypothetical protein
MGSSQPANTTISVLRRVRAVNENRRHTSIKHLTTPFDGQFVSVPGEEVLVVETRDAAFKSDAFRFGHPVVLAPRAGCSVPDVYAGVSGLDFPVRMVGNPREVQIQKTLANKADDLYQELRDTCPSDAFVA